MKISLEALQVLDAIDRTGSFAKAADELHKVRSALTHTVKKLESDLKITIFDRSGHKAKLTNTGKLLLKEGRKLLRDSLMLEDRIREIEQGWETELAVAYDDLIPIEFFIPILEEFYQACPHVSLRFIPERLSGLWDALFAKRVVLVIGAIGSETIDSKYSWFPWGEVSFDFCVAKNHTLANLPEPLTNEVISQYRSATAFDTSLNLPPRSSGQLLGQERLTLGSVDAKLKIQIAGLAVGYLPTFLSKPYIKNGQLVKKQTEGGKTTAMMQIVWDNTRRGKAMNWLINRLKLMEISLPISD